MHLALCDVNKLRLTQFQGRNTLHTLTDSNTCNNDSLALHTLRVSIND